MPSSPALAYPSAEVEALEREVEHHAAKLIFLARALAHHSQGSALPLDLERAAFDIRECLERVGSATERLKQLAKELPSQPAFPEFAP